MQTGPLTGTLLSLLLLYKYPALFLIEFISSFGVPLPAGAALVAGGIFAGQGYFSITYVILWSLAGNILGDLGLFLLTRKWGAKILKMFRIDINHKPKYFAHFEKALFHYPKLAVFLSRYIASVCSAVTALAGISPMTPGAFLFATTAGEVVNTVGYALIGFYFGFEWEDLSHLMVPIGLILLVVIIIFLVVRSRMKRSKKS